MSRSSDAETRRALLLDVIDHAFDEVSWHGPNLTGSYKGLSASQASRSVRGRKTIWEQLLHATYWKQRVLNKLTTTTRFPRRGSNWPPMPDERTEKSWRADQTLLRDVHARLRRAVVTLPPATLADRKILWHIYGSAAHDLYHAGQIRLVRRMIGASRKVRV
jgi:hypothetical protein